jgi:Spy/CpxP family protein refolding chaperone
MYLRVALFAFLLAALPLAGLAQKSPGNTPPGQTQSGARQNPSGESYGFWAMPPGMKMTMGMDHSLKVLQQELKLTDSQVSQIRQLVESRKSKFQSIHEQAGPKFEQLMSLLKGPNPDPTAVGKATIELKKVHQQAMAEQASMEKDFYGLLTDSQRTTVDKLRDQAPGVLALHRLGLLGSKGMGTEQASLAGH